MQCVISNWASTATPHLPLFGSSNSKAKRSKTQFLRNPNVYEEEDGDGSEGSLPLPPHVKSITSTSNPFVKHCVKLRLSSSYRHSHGSVLVVGTTPVREIYKFQESMQGRPATIKCLLLLDQAEFPEGLDDLPVRTVRVNSTVMKKLSGLQSIESIETISLMKIPLTFHNLDNWQEVDCHRWFPSPHRILVLDGIQDPGNLGTLLRSALAFRWGGVFLLPGCCDPFNDKALRASRGASFQIPIVSGGWIHLEALVNEFHMKILAGHPANSEQHKPVSRLSQGLVDSLVNIPLCLVLGSEGSGLSKRTVQASELVSIPMVGGFESLNVSVAGGIFLYMLQPLNHKFS
ncbi:uncharacterized protein LOC130777695 [Actinidia eriantha]|uniref:uncharacterized protein LOC130777695 n=1 Tax=Actinidia eriantha TaxID=165200 RepID=UPI002584A80C|nr:uncharacterized protein LOC130777695 [Actinidia eriantha]